MIHQFILFLISFLNLSYGRIRMHTSISYIVLKLSYLNSPDLGRVLSELE
jgi:hypothetical protein